MSSNRETIANPITVQEENYLTDITDCGNRLAAFRFWRDAMRYVIIFLIVALFCQVIIHWPIRHEETRGAVIWRSAHEKRDFYRLLRKHGQNNRISMISYDGSKAYLIDENGHKYLFK